ncbi:unnamed protein product [Rhizophagus irregularis]|uniref:MIR domain-containing protein n=1 Tax=Rhizophagus irregularis TaxID=588596 RepID=A0A915YZJ1_9GLOM|nr:unnamed protein product [Rhizophagus irregularis]
MKNTNSINESIKGFEDIVFEESDLIKNESIVALKHVATGKYLSSDGSYENLRYITGSPKQLVFVGGPEPDPNSLWKIKFDSRCTSPSTNYTEVSSCNNCYSHWHTYWNFNHILKGRTG